jgi:phospholipase C
MTSLPPPPSRTMTRRQVLAALAGVGGAAALSAPGRAFGLSPSPSLVARAAATAPAGSDLGAIEHIVFLMMENRSYDHYFGAYPRGRGFDDHPPDSLGAFAQDYPGASSLSPPDVLLPFHLTRAAGEECTDDLTHDYGPMHLCWNEGRMDSFVKVHTSAKYEGTRGAMTMGHYTRDELPFYYAAADAFTLCDGYHASILGPTHPNRLMANSGTIDPTGAHGGPVTDTNVTPDALWSCSWTTMQEVLEDAGIPWKVYSPSSVGLSPAYAALAGYPTWNPALYNPTVNPQIMFLSDHVLPYFSAFRDPVSPLYQKAFLPSFPADFIADVGSGSLPSVSWIIPPLGFDEHPSSAPDRGMFFTSMVLAALTANPAVWSKTAFFLMYDENDGWFDHVPPPTAPAGTPGEYLTVLPNKITSPTSDTLGIKGPIGLGVRVPMLVMSPFSRGGHVASEVFDHTSQLKLVSERFGVEVPNVSAWRRGVVGDLTSALFQGAANLSVPALPAPTLAQLEPSGSSCSELSQDSELGGVPPVVPGLQTMPTQSGTLLPASEFFGPAAGVPGTPITLAGPGTATAKSSANAFAQTGVVPTPAGATLPRTGGDPPIGAAAVLLAAGVAGAAALRVATAARVEDGDG